MLTKSDLPTAEAASSRSVLAARTRGTHELPLERHELPELTSSLGKPSPRRTSSTHVVLNDRDLAVVDLVFYARALTKQQIETAIFPAAKHTRCQRCLTRLVRIRALDRLARPSATDPAVYLLTRRSVLGNRFMRARYGETEFRRHFTRIGSLRHLLAVNDVRVLVERGCRELGWTLARWDRADELATRLKADGIVPDAYFQIKRPDGERLRTSGFFLELERAVKSRSVLESKLRRYVDLYQSGRYTELFGTTALRVLVAFTDELGGPGALRAQRGAEIAAKIPALFARLTSLEELKQTGPERCLVGPQWWSPGQPRPYPLFDLAADGPVHAEKEG
jgi:hypothetical protein